MKGLEIQDIEQLEKLEISEEVLNNQLELFKYGISPIRITATASLNNGILLFNDSDLVKYEEVFDDEKDKIKVIRFVPASGAASRMFKAFYQFLESGIENNEVKVFASGLNLFPFFGQIKCKNEPDYSCAISNMINVQKLAELPKALIPFHRYEDDQRTALEEHLAESAMILGKKKMVNIHFTISESHLNKFDQIIESRLDKYKLDFDCNYNLTFSYQSHSTDTVAVYPDNKLFRTNEGQLLFRPGGHGALIKNLDKLDYELIFVKNIDNVQPDHLKGEAIRYKKILAGYLLSVQKKVSNLLSKIDRNNFKLVEIEAFAQNELNIKLEESYQSLDKGAKVMYLQNKLNRPIRVCGMVRNEGEPGGGPFWVMNKNGEESLQIVESSQIDLKDDQQAKIFQKSSHFNPVDLVCWVKDYQGNKFELDKYVDPSTAFITEKSQSGQALKVLEHPGLWNGAMANWITLFVEVPISTFSPVKTINDLLRPQHQPA